MSVQLVDVPEAAAQLAVSVKTVRRLISAGGLPAVRVGRAVRIEQEELDAFVRRGRPRSRRAPEPEPITDGQRRALHAKAGDLDSRTGVGRGTSKKKILEEASERYGRPIVSANDLTVLEASWVLETLEERVEAC